MTTQPNANPPDASQRRYDWAVRHPFAFGDEPHAIAVVVTPWSGLLPRWRFVLPAEYENLLAWGTLQTADDTLETEPRGKITSGGTVRLQNGPAVVWLGANEPLSKATGAIVIWKPPAPHYIMFGQAKAPNEPPHSMEGITFGEPHEHPAVPA